MKFHQKEEGIYFYILCGVLALFFGTANPFLHIPLLILLYPAALFLLAKHARSAKRAFMYAFISGGLGASAALYWLAIPVHEYAFFPWVLAAFVPLCSGFYIALYGGIFSYGMHKAKFLSPWFQLIFAFVLWYMLEYIRSRFLTGITWMNLSAGNAAFPALVQGVSIIGMTGLSAFFAFIACCLVFPKKRIQVIGLLCLLLLVSLGFYRISQPISAENPSEYLLVQGNLSQDVKWEKGMQKATLEKYLSLTKEGLLKADEKGKKVSFVVYPETSMPFFLQNEASFREELFSFANAYDVNMLIGGVSFEQKENKNLIYNSLFSLKTEKNNEKNRQFTAQDIYSKQHLVPFGEYVPPLIDFKFLEALLQGFGGFTPKKNQLPLEHVIGEEKRNLGILICYEAIFSYLAQEQIEHNAQILINISNDAWYGISSAAKQHLDLSLLRAIEQKRYLVRATNTGISAIINPYGQIISASPLFQDFTLTATVGYIKEKTIYHFIYPYLTPIISLLFLIFLCILLLQKKKDKY